MRSFLPFEFNGPFTSILSHSFKSVVYFAFLCTNLLFGFAAAIKVLSIPHFYKSKDDGGGEFGSYSLFRGLQTMFYACFGNFDEEVSSIFDAILVVSIRVECN